MKEGDLTLLGHNRYHKNIMHNGYHHRGGTPMVWKNIKPSRVTIKEQQQMAMYGLVFIACLSVLAWLVRVFS
tara:strand:+ start:476 stop:691 length:216 start_codon:yes stop_codon:yes gene_type:complete